MSVLFLKRFQKLGYVLVIYFLAFALSLGRESFLFCHNHVLGVCMLVLQVCNGSSYLFAVSLFRMPIFSASASFCSSLSLSIVFPVALSYVVLMLLSVGIVAFSVWWTASMICLLGSESLL